jgi:hypothetical protein
MHPQYRFIAFCFSSFTIFLSAVFMSAALYFFGGCSFAQPSGLAPFSKNFTLP